MLMISNIDLEYGPPMKEIVEITENECKKIKIVIKYLLEKKEYLYLGEIEGKHSQVEMDLDELKGIEFIDADCKEKIAAYHLLRQYLPCSIVCERLLEYYDEELPKELSLDYEDEPQIEVE